MSKMNMESKTMWPMCLCGSKEISEYEISRRDWV